MKGGGNLRCGRGIGRGHTPTSDGDEEGCWLKGWTKNERVRFSDFERQGDEKSGGRRVNGSGEGGYYRREKERGRVPSRGGVAHGLDLAHPCLLPITTHVFSQ